MTSNAHNIAETETDIRRAVTIALLTYRRPEQLKRAVASVVAAAVPGDDAGWALAEILVIDNNPDGSAEPVVGELRRTEVGRSTTADGSHAATESAGIRYVHESEPGIVAARNRALDEARGDVLVFIDDDEIALPGWPHGLLEIMQNTASALVGGPVVTEFLEPPEQWVLDSGFFDIEVKPDGAPQTWLSTCNLAIDLQRIRDAGVRFDPRYPHGEDATFSRLAASKGLPLSWSATAKVKEYVEPERTTLAWRRQRHRISADAWVRAELDLDPSLRSQAGVLMRAATRLVQGLATTALGVVSRRRATTNSGLALVSQAMGALDGLVTHRARTPGGS